MSFGGISCHVDIYAENFSGTATTLQGAAVPIEFEEDDNDDLLTPVRAKSGYIRVIETEAGVLDGLEPTSAKSRFVECYYGSNVVFSGYMQHQNFDRPYTAYPREVEFPIISPIGLLDAFDFAPIAPPTAVSLGDLLKTVIAGLDAGYTHIITPEVDVFGRTLSSFVVSPFNDDFSHLLGTADDLYDPISYEDFMVGLCNAFGWTLHDTPTTLVFAMYEHMGKYVERDLTSFLPFTVISGNFVGILTSSFSFADNKATTSVIRPLKEVTLDYQGDRTDLYTLDFSRLQTVSKNSHWDTTGEAAVWLKTLNDEFSGARLLDETALLATGLRDYGVFLCAAGTRSGNEWNLHERILINPESSWSASENIITVKIYKRPLEAEFNVLVKYSWGDSVRTLDRDISVNHYCPEAFVKVGELWHHYELDPISGLYEHTWTTLMPVTGETSSQGVYNFDVANCPDGPVEIVFRLSHAYSPGLSLISIDELRVETSPDNFAAYTKDAPKTDTFKGDVDGLGEGSVSLLFDDYHETDNMLSGTTLSVDGPDYYTRYAFVLEQQQRLKGKFRHVGAHAIWSDYLCLHRFDGVDWRMIALSFSPIDDEYGIVLQRGESLNGTTYRYISCNFDNVIGNAPSRVEDGASLSVLLTGTPSNKVQENSVVVIMGEVDITSTAYNHATRTITIANVTANVSITAVGRPYDAEVEYLQSDGVAYIDSGIEPTNTLSFKVKFINNGPTNTGGYGNVFGARQDSFNNIYQITLFRGGQVRIGNATNSIPMNTGTIYEVEFDGDKTIVCNGNTYTASKGAINLPSGSTILMFCIRSGGAPAQLQAGRIYYCSFGSVRDFIPVRNNGVGYLYDKVSGQLFGNAASSGTFTYGNDKT